MYEEERMPDRQEDAAPEEERPAEQPEGERRLSDEEVAAAARAFLGEAAPPKEDEGEEY